MSLAFISDPHFHAHKTMATIDKDGVNSRLQATLSAFRKGVLSAHKMGCTALIVAGDIFHTRGTLKPSTLSLVADELSCLAGYMPIYLMAGNHDMERYSGGETAIDTLGYINGVSVITRPLETTICGRSVGFIPYIHDTEEFKRAFEVLAKTSDVIVMHQGIDNFKPNAGMPDVGISADYLAREFEGCVFSGHYHSPRNFKNQVISVGSLTQQDFGDEGDDRGMWTLLNGDIPRFHPIESPRFIRVADSPEHRANGFSVEIVKGNYIKAISSTVKGLDKLEKMCLANGALGIQKELVREFTKSRTETITISDPLTMIGSYIDITPKYKPHKDELLKEYVAVKAGVSS